MFTSNKFFIGLVAATIFVAGAGYILYSGRPVMKNKTPRTIAENQTVTATEKTVLQTYAMADIQAHNASSSCWSAIGGDVYDLTSWITRHPGGTEAIIKLCGTDGTAAYTNQHGDSKRPKSVLILLKIGALK